MRIVGRYELIDKGGYCLERRGTFLLGHEVEHRLKHRAAAQNTSPSQRAA